jgi:hypothetical protein
VVIGASAGAVLVLMQPLLHKVPPGPQPAGAAAAGLPQAMPRGLRRASRGH